MTLRYILAGLAAVLSGAAIADDDAAFTADELSVAKFWEDMGPTLRDRGVEAYAERYHDEFRHWDIQGAGGFAGKDSAVAYWTSFHDAGHRITCTYVEPVTVDIVGDRAFARLVYEQTISYADGRAETGVWRMVNIFERSGETWRVLESNMIDIAGDNDAAAAPPAYERHCPDA